MDSAPLEPDLGKHQRGVGSSRQLGNWPPRRRQLVTWFRSKAAPLADAYEGAIRLLEEEDFPGRVHLLAHAVRDIADRLVFVLDPQAESTRVQYEKEVEEIEKLWPSLDTIEGATDGSAVRSTVTIDRVLALKIDSLVRAHHERRQALSSYELLFRYLMREEVSGADVNGRLVADFKKTRDWFMRLAHFPAKEVAAVNGTELRTQFSRFEWMLHSFVGDFFTGTAQLDEILRQANR